jgi:hypothetical protein
MELPKLSVPPTPSGLLLDLRGELTPEEVVGRIEGWLEKANAWIKDAIERGFVPVPGHAATVKQTLWMNLAANERIPAGVLIPSPFFQHVTVSLNEWDSAEDIEKAHLGADQMGRAICDGLLESGWVPGGLPLDGVRPNVTTLIYYPAQKKQGGLAVPDARAMLGGAGGMPPIRGIGG